MMAILSELKTDLKNIRKMNGTFNKKKVKEVESAIKKIESTLREKE